MAKTSKHIDQKRDGLAIKAEYLQTDLWAIRSILIAEIMTFAVCDPCTGDGRMAKLAKAHGYDVTASDKYAWGFGDQNMDFLDSRNTDFFLPRVMNATVFMNPPFSLACQFVDKAMELGARKIVCFQRSVWRESDERRKWWLLNPYNRRYQCGNRAICWYGTIPLDKRKGGAYQPHAWYVWEVGHPLGQLEGTIWKDDK